MQESYLEKKSQSPLYMQLMTRLKNDIEAGVYPAGARIPSEQVLCDTYGVSRVTVRKAMLDLVQEGLLIRRQGKGTFVADEKIRRDLSAITSFTLACAQRGHQAGSRFISVQTDDASSEDCARLELPEGSRLIEITRLRLCDGEPVMLEINRYPARYDFLLPNPEAASQYACLKENGVIPTSAVHDISLTHATPFVSKHLHTEVGEALLLLDELVFNQHGEPLHLSRQWIRGDKFTFRI
ncbi:MAG: GntR family transcriptional regulator [Clostridia bacterium]|nr:GntR family transcriptional regulator [Clostridia bacterium]